MELYYATTNPGKVHSLRRDLKAFGIEVVQTVLNIPESRSDNPEEIAKQKVEFAWRELLKPVVAVDAGFYIHSLKGFPRTFVNFVLETINLEGILKLVEGKERGCEFRESLAYRDHLFTEPKCFTVYVPGMLSLEPAGELESHHWSRLSLVFVPKDETKTLAQMTKEEYLDWRGRKRASAAKALGEWLTTRESQTER